MSFDMAYNAFFVLLLLMLCYLRLHMQQDTIAAFRHSVRPHDRARVVT